MEALSQDNDAAPPRTPSPPPRTPPTPEPVPKTPAEAMVDLLGEEAARRATGDFIPPKPRMLYTLEDSSDDELEELEPDFEPVERVIDGVMQVRDLVYFSDKVIPGVLQVSYMGKVAI